MRINKYINERKSEYFDIKVSQKTIENSWDKLELKMEKCQKRYSNLRIAAFVSVLLILTSGIVVAKAQYSKPGEILFSLKVISNDIKVAVDGKTKEAPTPKPLRDEIKSEVYIPTPEASPISNDINNDNRENNEASKSGDKLEDKFETEMEFFEYYKNKSKENDEEDDDEKGDDDENNNDNKGNKKSKFWFFEKKREIKEEIKSR